MKIPRLFHPVAALLMLLLGAVSARADAPRLANLSTRASVGTGGNIMITGFIIGPGPNKTVLVRAVGPSLASFGLTNLLADPAVAIYNSAGAQIAFNDDWNAADAATMTSVGAFALPAGSKDAAIVTSLPSGLYTAEVSGNGGTTGLGLLEIYEVGSDPASSRLVNLSTRAVVGSNSNIMIGGLIISSGTGTRRLLVRAAGPALGPLGVANVLTDPVLTVLNSSGATFATNDNWGTPLGNGASDATTLSAAFNQAGAFAFPAGSADSALIADFTPGNYTIQVSGAGGAGGVALVEIYDITPAGSSVLSVTASRASADTSGSNPGEFTVTRTGDTQLPLVVTYAVGGTAVNGGDYSALSGTVTIPAGTASTTVSVTPIPSINATGSTTVTLTLASGASYTLGSPASATVTIKNLPASLYVATLRPAAGATDSTASGTATLLLSPDGSYASVSVSFSNLTSTEVVAHVKVGSLTSNGAYVMSMPNGQVSNALWFFNPTGTYSSADLVAALKSGNLYVGIDSAEYPNGELSGSFILSAGSQTFVAPPAPTALDLSHATATDAARLLAQATFGPKQSEIDALTGNSIDAWITAQLALPFTSHHAATLADFNAFGGNPSDNAVYAPNRQAAWWKTVTTAPDQLRQRVAFALSELFVVSDVALGQAYTEGLSSYYDVLGNGAFGNFRTLLENVTLSPIMGNYLSTVRNAKADPVAGTSPDENYAREVMQLFTVGLNLLQPDGTLMLDSNGLPIPTYNQTVVTEMAKVFTGWSYFSTKSNPSFYTGATDLLDPMMLYPAYHDTTQKNLLNNVVIPANQGGTQDLKLTLDALFNHPNTAPFVCRQLIQRLVTSNPSPAYVYRVAQVFANNGAGVRGDLAAVVRAILTDYEARSTSLLDNVSYGKLKEPLLRATGLLRTFNATPANGRYSAGSFSSPDVNLDEAALRSPTVFNFFHPGYVLPGPLASAGLVAPEFEITDATFSIDVPNYLRNFIFPSGTTPPVTLDLSAEQALVSNPSALLSHLSLVLCGGNLPSAAITRITTALNALPGSTTSLERAETAVLLVTTSPTGAVQK